MWSKSVWGRRSKLEEGWKQALNLLVKCLFCSFGWREWVGGRKDKQQSHYNLARVQSRSYICAFNSAWESHFKEIQLLHALVLPHPGRYICTLQSFWITSNVSWRLSNPVKTNLREITLQFFSSSGFTVRKNPRVAHERCLKKTGNLARKFKMVCKNMADREFDRSTASPWNEMWLTSPILFSIWWFLRIQAIGSAGQNYCGFPDFKCPTLLLLTMWPSRISVRSIQDTL